MPNISIVVPEVQQSVLRPIVIDVIRQLEAITKVSSDSAILFPGELNKTYQPGSAVTESKTDRTQFLDNDIVQIEVEEDFNKDSVYTTAVTRDEQLPIFWDDKIGIFIKPVYVTTEISINFKFRSKSKTTIQRWRDDLRMRISMARDINLHQLRYSYLIPGEFINILMEIHRLRENVAPYNEEFNTYLENNASTRLTTLSNLSGATTELGIAETQMRVVGYFDFEGFPDKPEHDEDNDTWVATFSYKFKYEKPIACNMRYPVMVHNQILSEKFRPSEKDVYDLDNHLQSFSLSMGAFNKFEAQLQIENYLNPKAVITIPSFDEFIPASVISGTTNVFNALCQLTDTDKKTLLNLKELGTIALDQDVLDFIEQSEWPYIKKTYQSIIQVSIYKSMTCMSPEFCDVKPNLDICAVNDLDIRVNHRVRLSIVTDLNLLNPQALARLKKYPKALVKIIQSVNEGLRNNPGFTDLGLKRYIDRNDIYNYILKPNPLGNRISLNLSSLFVSTKSNSDNYLLSLLRNLLNTINSLVIEVKYEKYLDILPKALELQIFTQAVYNNLTNNDYTDLLLKILTIQGNVEVILAMIQSRTNNNNSLFSIYSINSAVIFLIKVLRSQKDGTENAIVDSTNRFTVMNTNVVARDGIRGAALSDYKG